MTFQLWELVENSEGGRWADYKNQITGEHSVKTHDLKKIWEACSDHYFKEEGSSRNLICTKCGFGTKYVLGIHKLENGKLVKIKE